MKLRRPRDSDELIDERAFEREEYLPYWADLWPSSRALAAALVEQPPRGLRVLELGCGLALPSIAAAMLGAAEVLATDWSADALAFAGVNAALNGVTLPTLLSRWDDPEATIARGAWDLVIAADVLYEQRNVDELLPLLPRLVGVEGRVVVADPDRVPAQRFLREAAAAWLVESRQASERKVVLHTLRPRDQRW
jgi:predicted nicotinamide N-methyase